MMKEPEKKILDRFFSTIKKWTGQHRVSTMEQVKMAALAMLPSWDELANEQEDRRAERLLEKVDQVCFCFKNCFLNEDLSTDTWAMAEVSVCVESAVLSYSLKPSIVAVTVLSYFLCIKQSTLHYENTSFDLCQSNCFRSHY